MNISDLTGIRQRIENGYYVNTKEYPKKTENMRAGYITDEDKSIKWNKEQVELANQEYNKKRREYMEKGHRLAALFKQDIIDYLMNFYNLNEKAALVIFNKAYEEGHSDGYICILDYVYDYIEFIADVIDANGGTVHV